METLDIIKELCEKKGISISQLENKLEFGNGSLSKSKNMSADRLYQVAKFFDVSMEYMMTGKTIDEADDEMTKLRQQQSILMEINKVSQQMSEYYKKIANTKNTIAVCFILCSALFFLTYRYSGISDFELFSSLMMFIITAMSSVVLSYSLITLLGPENFDTDKFYLNVGAVAVMSFVLGKSFWWENGFGKTAVISASIFFFVLQCVLHIIKFRKTYQQSLKQLELYYDEEEDNKTELYFQIYKDRSILNPSLWLAQ